MIKPDIIVSHPGKQHVYQLIYYLQKHGFLKQFITTVWFNNNAFPYFFLNCLPNQYKAAVIKKLKTRFNESIENNLVEQFPYVEFARKLLNKRISVFSGERGVLAVSQAHDYYVSQRLKKFTSKILIGYELSSYRSFNIAKRMGMTTILDLASVHYKFIESLANTYSDFKSTIADQRIFNKVNRIKLKEYELADYIFTISELSKETLIVNGIPEEKIYLINLGIDHNMFKLKSQYNKSNVMKLLYVGNVSQRKGVEIILKAVKKINKKDIELTLIGGMSKGNQLISKYEGLYNYIPQLEQEELEKYYQEADLLLFPSYMDGWGFVVLESMSCGTPVIVSEYTGAKDAVISGENGFIIPVNDVNALVSKIEYFYNNKEKISEFGQKAFKISNNYRWENYGNRIKDVILSIAKKEKFYN